MTAPRRGIQSVEISVQVLEALERAGGAAPLSKLAALSAMPASKVHRYLVSLVRSGLVSQSAETGLYDLGPAARRLGTEAIRRLDEGNVAGRHVVALRDRTGHSVNLTAWGEAGPTIIRWDFGRYPMHVTVRVGGTLPLWSAVGRVFMAFLPGVITRPVFERQRGVGIPDDADFAALDDELGVIRRTRLSSVSNTPVLGIDGFAAPVFDAAAQVPLVVGIVGHRADLAAGGRDHVTAELAAAAEAISLDLGHRRDTADSPLAGDALARNSPLALESTNSKR